MAPHRVSFLKTALAKEIEGQFDAILPSSQDSSLFYFFHQDHYWLTHNYKQRETVYQTKLSQISSELSSVQASVTLEDGRMYLFSGDRYYRVAPASTSSNWTRQKRLRVSETSFYQTLKERHTETQI